MEPTRRAVIDVGTNSVKLLVADVVGREVRPVWEESKQTRLGKGFYDSHHLQAEPIAATAAAVAVFVETARARQAFSVDVIATSAARDAVNAQELTSAIERSSGLPVRIISGQQEADWAFQGVVTNPQLAEIPLLLLDVGGGSTEFILGDGLQEDFAGSFALGTVRLLESQSPGDPPAPAELAACRQKVSQFLQTEVRPRLEPALRRQAAAVALVGTGGTTSILGCMEAGLDKFDRALLEQTRLSLDRVTAQVERLWSLPLEARKQIPGLPKNRADVILMGVTIYEAVMRQFGFRELRISTRGLRFGALLRPR